MRVNKGAAYKNGFPCQFWIRKVALVRKYPKIKFVCLRLSVTLIVLSALSIACKESSHSVLAPTMADIPILEQATPSATIAKTVSLIPTPSPSLLPVATIPSTKVTIPTVAPTAIAEVLTVTKAENFLPVPKPAEPALLPTVPATIPPVSGDHGPCQGFEGMYLLLCQAMNQPPPQDNVPSYGHHMGPPVLQNLLIENLGPFNSDNGTSGDFKLDRRFDHAVFDEFGRIHNPGQENQYDNPTFEYKLPADTKVLIPIDGVVDRVSWQETSSYKQDDWEIFIKPSRGSSWIVVIDHVVSIDCDRLSSAVCDLRLKIEGQELGPGTRVKAGQVLGFVGNWDDQSGAGIKGRTELTIGEQRDDGFYNYCPTTMLSDDLKQSLESDLTNFMADYEKWTGDQEMYAQDEMSTPGCLYSIIKEVDGKTYPVN